MARRKVKIEINVDAIDKVASSLDARDDAPLYFQGEITLKAWSRKDGMVDLKLDSNTGPVCRAGLASHGEKFTRPGQGERVDLRVPDEEVDWSSGAREYVSVVVGQLVQETWVVRSLDENGAPRLAYECSVRVKLNDLLADSRRGLEWLLAMFVDGVEPLVRAHRYVPAAAPAPEPEALPFLDAVADATVAELVAVADYAERIAAMATSDLNALAHHLHIETTDQDRSDVIAAICDVIGARRAEVS